jgi:hypothetical protein
VFKSLARPFFGPEMLVRMQKVRAQYKKPNEQEPRRKWELIQKATLDERIAKMARYDQLTCLQWGKLNNHNSDPYADAERAMPSKLSEAMQIGAPSNDPLSEVRLIEYALFQRQYLNSEIRRP